MLRRQNQLYKNRIASLLKGNLPGSVRKKVVQSELKGKFSPAQLGMLCDKKQRQYTKKWSNCDYAKAMKLRCISSKALMHVRKNHVPLPALTTLTRKFGFIHICPGIIKSVVEYLRARVPDWTPRERLACLAFDEMQVANIGEIDRKLDMVVGPNKNVQVVMVRGIAASWKFPVFLDFDFPMNVPTLSQIICSLEAINVQVLITVCDQGGSNEGLAKRLKITPEDTSFRNPFDSARSIFFAFDYVHVYKNLRNHLMDNVAEFEDGTKTSKKDFQILKETVSGEITCGYKITDLHLDCAGTDRQVVKLATDLVSEETAAMFRRFFETDAPKCTLANFLEVAHLSFKVMNSRLPKDPKDKFKSGFGVHFMQQRDILMMMIEYFEKLKFSGKKKKFQRGGIISIKSVIALQKKLKEEYDLPFLLTSHTTQDFEESFFATMRSMGGSNNDNPSPLQFNYRVGRHLCSKFLEDEKFDIFSLKDVLAHNDHGVSDSHDEAEGEFDLQREIPLTLKESQSEGLFWIAGYVAFKMKSVRPDLGSLKNDDDDNQASSAFVDLVNRGGLRYPSKIWKEDFTKMHSVFCRFHPPNDLIRMKPGVLTGFFKKLKSNFPGYCDKILMLVSRTFTFIRLRKVNQIAQAKKKRQKNRVSTLRGKKKLAMLSH